MPSLAVRKGTGRRVCRYESQDYFRIDPSGLNAHREMDPGLLSNLFQTNVGRFYRRCQLASRPIACTRDHCAMLPRVPA